MKRKFSQDFFKTNKDKDELYSWELAYDLYNAYVEKTFGDGITKMCDIADYLGTSKSLISKYINAVKFNNSMKLKKKYSVKKTYTLSTLKYDYEPFLQYMKEKKIDINKISSGELENEVIKYKGTEKKYKKVKIKLNGKEYLIPKVVLDKYEVKSKGS